MEIRKQVEESAAKLETLGVIVDATALASCRAIRACAVRYNEMLEKAYSAHGVNSSGAEVLISLLLDMDPRGITLANLAKDHGVTPASMTNRIDQLAVKDLVERVNSKDDRRISYAKLTKTGKKTAEAVLPIQSEIASSYLKGLKKGDRKDFSKLVVKLAESTGEESS